MNRGTARSGRASSLRPSAWKKDLPAALLFLILSLAMTAPLAWNLTDHVPSDLGDPLYNIWAMSWQVEKFKSGPGGLAGYWDGNVFHPHKGTLLYADHIFALAVMSFPLALAGGNMVAAYNILFILTFFLCALGTYALVLYLTRSRTAAVIAGLIAAFFPYNFGHISHLELLSFGWMPLCLLFLHKFFDRPSYKNLAGAGISFILQALTCAYYGVYLAVFVALFVVYFVYKKKLFRKPDIWLKLGILALGCGLVLFPFYYPYSHIHERMMFAREFHEVSYYSAQLQHFLAVPSWNVAWGGLLGARSGSSEWQLFPGLAAILLCILWWVLRRRERARELREEHVRGFFWWDIGLALFALLLLQIWWSGGFTLRLAGIDLLSMHSLQKPLIVFSLALVLRLMFSWRRRKNPETPAACPSSESLAQRFYSFAAVFAFLLSLGPVIQLSDKKLMAGPYLFLSEWVPVFRGIRAPSRFVVIMMLALSVLAGWAVARLEKTRPFFKRRRLAGALLGILVVVEYVSVPMPLAAIRKGNDIPPIYRTVKSLPRDSVLLELPLGVHPEKISHEARYMYYSTYHGKKLVNGYSGYFPPGYLILREALEFFPSPETNNLLRKLGVNYVLVHTEGFRAAKSRRTAMRLGALTGDFEFVRREENDFLFRLLPQNVPPEVQQRRISEVGRKELWKASSLRNNELAPLAFDGDAETAWTSGMPQIQDEYFSLDLGEALELSEVRLFLGRSPLDYPRAYRLEGSEDAQAWTLLEENMNGFPDIDASMVEDFSRYQMRFRFEAIKVRHLRLTLVTGHPMAFWTIREITCWK